MRMRDTPHRLIAHSSRPPTSTARRCATAQRPTAPTNAAVRPPPSSTTGGAGGSGNSSSGAGMSSSDTMTIAVIPTTE
jgi:hypothetical protein